MGQVEEDASFVVRSPHRTAVLERLAEGAAIPAQVRNDTGLEYSRISEAANGLRERNLVDLIVEEETKRGRLYETTDRGNEAIEFMRNHGMLSDQEEYRRR
jgi:DNA-binding MarR family transcriptional regulator